MKAAVMTILGGLMLAGGAHAEDIGDRDAGRKLASQCRTCHGLEGYAQIPIAPHIGGEPASYIRAQLTAFRDGTREHEMMSIVAKMLSDQQIADLAAWYSGHRVQVSLTQDPSAAPEQCVACHGADGLHVAEDVPNLAGEANIYIDTQLKAFRTGKRQHDIMTPMAQSLSDSEIREIADWYADIGLEIELVE
ncbi:c-type cytochrome [Roseovarius litoreus]